MFVLQYLDVGLDWHCFVVQIDNPEGGEHHIEKEREYYPPTIWAESMNEMDNV